MRASTPSRSTRRARCFFVRAASLFFPVLAAASGCSSGGAGATCPPGLAGCSGGCTDTRHDPMNCGACGIACAVGDVCVSGECVVQCPAGSTECNGLCAVLATDDANCGACGNACPPGQVCSQGACGETCAAGYSACPSSGAAAYCADLMTNRENCGACDRACPAGEICATGACAPTCATGTTTCTGTAGGPYCANLKDDVANCGACGNACSAGQTCVSGKCACPVVKPNACGSGPAAFCTSFANDSQNCGSCGAPCPAGTICSAGACAATCASGWTPCPSTGTPVTCANLSDDVANCGACGNPCPAGQSCVSGACASVCGAGLAVCGRACVDLASDVEHCGACSVACAPDDRCVSGGCAAGGPVGYWPLEGDAADLSGSDNDGSLAGGPSFTAGYAGQALSLNGTTQYEQVKSSPSLDATTGVTMEAWVFPTVVLPHATIINKEIAYEMALNNGVLQCAISHSLDSTLWYWVGSWSVRTGVWSHVACSFDGTAIRLYANGALVDENTDPGPVVVTPFDLGIGARSVGTSCSGCTLGSFFAGTIDEARVYDYARSAAQLEDDATLEAHYTFDSGLGIDSGPNHLHGTVVDAMTLPGRLGQAIAVSGSASSYFQAGGFTGLAPVGEPFTLEGWIDPSADSGVLFYVSQYPDGSGSCIPYLGFSGGQLVGRVWSSKDMTVTAPVSIPTGTWTHVALTWDTSGDLDLYVGGTLVGSTPGTSNALARPATVLTLGSAIAGASCARGMGDYAGGFDDVRVYTRALSPAEIAAQANP